jgi:hypothetical protein
MQRLPHFRPVGVVIHLRRFRLIVGQDLTIGLDQGDAVVGSLSEFK